MTLTREHTQARITPNSFLCFTVKLVNRVVAVHFLEAIFNSNRQSDR